MLSYLFYFVLLALAIVLYLTFVQDDTADAHERNGEAPAGEKLVRVYSTKDAWKAGIVKSAFEQKGVEYVMAGEQMAHMYGNIPGFDINILVQASDCGAAIRIIEDLFGDERTE